jgi:hypothetical protein
MRGAGLGLRFFLQGGLQVAAGFAAVVALLAFYSAPGAEGQINRLEAKARKESDINRDGSEICTRPVSARCRRR